MSAKKIADQTRVFEIIAVVITGLGKFIFMDWLEWRFFYIASACLFWIVYILYKFRQDDQILKYWGLTSKNFKQTFLELLPLILICIGLFVFVGNRMGTNILNWSIVPILLIYPIWGIVQQFVIVGLIARNLKDLERSNIPNLAIILLTAFVFAFVHYPHYVLIVGTFFLALFYTWIYLKNRNLIVLGIYHGWLGAFFFYTILQRDAWKEVFGGIGF